jgi:hypothetical protein
LFFILVLFIFFLVFRLVLLFIGLVIFEALDLLLVLDLLGDIVLSTFSVSEAGAVLFEVLVVLVLLFFVFLFFIIYTAEALVDQVHEDSLGEVAELAQRLQVVGLSLHCVVGYGLYLLQQLDDVEVLFPELNV